MSITTENGVWTYSADDIAALKPGSTAEENACWAFAIIFAGKTVSFYRDGQKTTGTVIGHGKLPIDPGNWYVMIEPDEDRGMRLSRESVLNVATAHGGILRHDKPEYRGCFGETLGLVEPNFVKQHSARFPHICPSCKKPAYDGAYAYEHEATGTRMCPS